MPPLKRCPRCKFELPIEDFGFRDRAHTKVQSYCRSCSNLAWTQWYSKGTNRESHRKLMSKRRARRNRRHRQLVDDAKSVPCTDCGGRYPPHVMDLDHLADKQGEISRLMYSVGTERLIREIAKCEVVCANCHRIRTHDRSIAG